jgi:hypothetical protein
MTEASDLGISMALSSDAKRRVITLPGSVSE